MKEPITPEGLSYLSDENLKWCAEYYFVELCKRDLAKADAFLYYLDGVWMGQRDRGLNEEYQDIQRDA